MVQSRRAFPWFFLAVLACLFVLSTASPRLWVEPHAKCRTASDELSLQRSDSSIPPSLTYPDYSPEVDRTDTVHANASPEQGEAAAVSATSSTSPGCLPLKLKVIGDNDESDGPHPNPLSEKDGTEAVEPAGKIGAQPTDAPDVPAAEGPEPCPPAAPLPESIRRLPIIVANIPSPIRSAPRDDVRPSEEMFYPDTDQRHPLSTLSTLSKTPAARPEHIEHSADDSWREPETLLESLNVLAAARPTGKWATEAIRQIRALGPAVAGGLDESSAILERLAELNRQAPQLAAGISDKLLARKLRKTGYALKRRLDVWQQVVRLGVPQPVDDVAPNVDPQKLAMCLAEIDSLTDNSPQGQAWRNYLLIDALKGSSGRQQHEDDRTTRQIAQQVLARLTQTPLSPHQQQFMASEPVAALRGELRRWAAEPVGAAAVLRDIESYESSALPSDARRLALDCQYLAASATDGRRQLANSIDLHYRNANLRIAVTEELLNKLIPERNLEYAPVADRVLGRRVRGESLMASEVAVRMLPDPARVRMALEITGEIAAATTAEAGPTRFHNDSESYYIARKPLEIDMNGISLWPVEVGVENQTQLRGVETPLDWVPLIGAGAKWVAKSQMEQSQPAATREIKQKVAAQARQRVDDEVRQRLGEIVDRMNQRVFDPLNSLSLDPQLVDAETTEKRFTMRLRLAGEDQLGSHTPRPQAPADSLASVQIHESVLNNGIQRLQLCGRTFTLPELSKHVAARLNRPASWEINPDQADVKIAFAKKDAVVVRCQDGQVVLTLSIAQLSKSPRKWKDFQIRAFYRPEVHGRSAQLVRDGVIHLIGQRLNAGAQIALRGIFSRALSKNNAWDLVPEQIVNEPKLDYAAITQFAIDDGWIGISLGPKPPASTARRPLWGVR